MKLADLGEFGLIHRFAQHFQLPDSDQNLGIGDDAAVIPLNEQEAWLVTTDLLIEDRHFLMDKITPYELGYKSLAVNLSDIAAMGGYPHSAFLSVAFPKNLDVGLIDAFFQGVKALADESQTRLLGGDTTKSPQGIVVNFVVLGRAHPSRIKYRRSARPGDLICLTDTVGDSGGGLRTLTDELPRDDALDYLVRRHHLPRPHLPEGQWLAAQTAVRALIDLSDGVESDITRIMESAGVGAQIDLDALPLSEVLQRKAGAHGWNAPELAATAGEDYCLMATVPAEAYDRLAAEFEQKFARPLYSIGTITGQEGLLQFRQNGQPVQLGAKGFDHFKS